MAPAKPRAKTEDVIIYNGRFNPFHLGHAYVLAEALKRAKLVIVLVGSSGLSRSLKNPFNFSERRQMLIRWYERNMPTDESWGVLKVVASRDYPYNDTLWQRNVQRLVKETISASNMFTSAVAKPSIKIIGSDRDESTWYLHAFPQWPTILLSPYMQNGALNVSATDVRAWLFGSELPPAVIPDNATLLSKFTLALAAGKKVLMSFIEELLQSKLADAPQDFSHIPDALPDTTLEFLTAFKKTQDFSSLVATYKYVTDYKRRAKVYPYPPIYQTVDAIIVQSGHILTVVRGHEPGKGLWALPGGFVNASERLRTAAIREAIEETSIKLAEGKNWKKITEDILRGSIRAAEVFDKPDRSDRGRTITHAYFFRLDDTKPLPQVRGSTQGNYDPECDVTECFWLPINEALERMDMWFEDHHALVEWAAGHIDREARA